MEFPVGGEEAKFWVVVMRMGRRGLLRRPWVRGPKHFGTSETGACLRSSGGLKTLDTVDLGIWACRRRVWVGEYARALPSGDGWASGRRKVS